MLGFSFLEFAVIAIVALLVLGPKRLPALAKTIGKLLGQSKRWWQQTQDDIKKSMDNTDPTDKQQKL